MISENGNMADRVGVVLINYHRDESALTAMREVLRNARSSGLAARGVLVDNGQSISGDYRSEGFEVLPLPNPGYAAAANEGANRLLGWADYLLFATHEIRIVGGSLDTLVETAAGYSVGSVGPVLRYPSGKLLSAGVRLRGGLATHLGARDLQQRPYKVDSLDGSFWLVSARAWRIVGDLEESFFLYWEETEWHRRALGQGLSAVLDPRLTVEALPSSAAESAYYLARNRYLYIRLSTENRRERFSHMTTAVLRDLWHLFLGLTSAFVRVPDNRRTRLLRMRLRMLGLLEGLLGVKGPRCLKKRGSGLA